MRIGLLGGSFDPPHQGHVHVTTRALAGFGLDRVWWLVSPGNPLKPKEPEAMARRLRACNALMRHPKVEVSDLEVRLGTRLTADTLAALTKRYPYARFVWVMGADNMSGFHRWDRWRRIAAQVPLGVVARPGEQLRAGLSPAARRLARHRIGASQARGLALREAPAWALLTGPMSGHSSTKVREGGGWP
ncbi:MAG: nicotinate-nucleotide adenylyltransferase [Pseudomonadota bacterium]